MVKQNQYFPQTVSHPGIDLSEKLNELGMGPKEFALRTGKPEKTISAIIKGNSSITPDMAIQFENALKIPANYWLTRQYHFDECLTRNVRKKLLSKSLTWAKHFPIEEMIKIGWLNDGKNMLEKTSELLKFFGVSNHAAWERFYLKQQLKVAFSISLAHTKDPYLISVWLRKGELQAAELQTNYYSEKKFKIVLSEINSIKTKNPNDLFEKLQIVCLEAGVKVVQTKSLGKSSMNGSARWINNTPLIQLTESFKSNDSLKYIFCHEAAHILLHGKKDVFLENIDYSAKDEQKEREADEFSRKLTINN